ncbi:MAG: aminopeptidase P family protein [Clostridiales bacterium]|nr:aminopeptidase P family protein [Clostridiales bacterium]
MREELIAQKNKVFLITDRSAREYFTGIDNAEGVLLVGKINAYFTDARYFYALRDKLRESEFYVAEQQGVESICKYLMENKIKKAYADFDKISVAEFFEYKKHGVKLLDGKKEINDVLTEKKEFEISAIRTACGISERALYETLPYVKLGVTEKEIANRLEENVRNLCGEGMAFETIVAFGKNSAIPHHVTGDTPLKENQAVLIDFGAKYQGFCADMTRTFFFGKPSEKFLTAYKAVLNANQKAEREIKCGTTAKDAHLVAVRELDRYSLSKYFKHSLGHGIGHDIHESPSLSVKSEAVLKENMVFTIEPGVYFENEFGIRIEDTVILTNSGINRFFTDGKGLMIIK